MIHEKLTAEIISAFYEVHRILGFGFLEQVYQNALYKELIRRGLKCECQKELNVYYKNEIVGTYRPDIIVEDKVILKLLSIPKSLYLQQ